MNTILEYLEWRGDLTMQERPLNEVDNLILSELSYYCLEDVLQGEEEITVAEAYARHKTATCTGDYSLNDPVPLLRACAKSKRFGNIKLKNYTTLTDTDRQLQFAAVTFVLEETAIYIAFRGTDTTIVGWREDCNFSFMHETPAQAEAVNYLNRVVPECKAPVYVGGHSKGGNLAVYASAFCAEENKERILAVYSNDGPGFNEYVVGRPEFSKILPKVQLIVPESSVVAILLSNTPIAKTVPCNTKKILMQHSPYTWGVGCDRFLSKEKRSSVSSTLQDIMQQWITALSYEQREMFVRSLFDSLEASGAKTLSDILDQQWIGFNAFIASVKHQDTSFKNNFTQALKKLVACTGGTIWNNRKKKFEPKNSKKLKALPSNRKKK